MKLPLSILLCSAAALSAADFSFQGIGWFDNGSDSAATGISGDGTAVVGNCYIGNDGRFGFRWTAAGGMVNIGEAEGWSESNARAVSFDGNTVAGESGSFSDFVPVRWKQVGGLQPLGFQAEGQRFGQGEGISNDGNVIVGVLGTTNGYEAMRWTQAGGYQLLGDLDGGRFWSWAYSCNADGNVVVGYGAVPQPAGESFAFEAFRWTPAAGMQSIGDLDGGDVDAAAYACSADGNVIVGVAEDATGHVGFRWTQATGMVSLGDLPGGAMYGIATDVSADGKVVVGTGNSGDSDGAWIWSQETGILDLKDYLIAKGLNVGAWTLSQCTGISDDGTVLCGVGKNPEGKSESWIARIDSLVAPALGTLSLNPARVVGGEDVTGTVDLNRAAATGGVQVNLSDNTSVITTPVSVTVLEGQSQAQFPINTGAVGSVVTRQVMATYDGKTKTANLTLTPVIKLVSLTLNPTSVVGGNSTLGTVTLNTPAEGAGVTVNLTDNTSAITTPASVLVPTGKTAASFPVSTSAVTVVATRQVSASYNGTTRSASLTLNPSPGLKSITTSMFNVVAGQKAVGTISLNNPAPAGGAVISVSDNSAVLTSPSEVIVAGGATSVQFDIFTLPVNAATPVSVTAKLNAETRTANMNINPGPALVSITLSPTTVKGGTSTTATVTISSVAPLGGIWISLTDNTSAINAPARIQIPAGAKTGTIAIPTSAVTATATRQVYAVHGVTKTANLTLTP